MTSLTAADYADTGQWRLNVDIRPRGISAFLENTLHDDVEPQLLFAEHWEENPDTLLKNIENAVYDHPRVLDDFAARITLHDPRTIFVPQGYETETGGEETVYSELFGVDESEVMAETQNGTTAVHCLCEGLKGFLSRTFPGARTASALTDLFRRTASEGLRLGIQLGKGEADFLLADGPDLLCAATQKTESGADIAYHAFNMFETSGVNPKEAYVEVWGGNLPEDALEAFQTHTAGIVNESEK